MSKRGGVDYSKWDRMDFSDDDDENDNDSSELNNSSSTKPRVTTLDGPSRITRDPDGTINIVGDSDIPTARQQQQQQPQHKLTTVKTKTNNVTSSPITTERSVAHDTKKEDEQQQQHDKQVSILTRNGSSFIDSVTKSRVYWCQDRQDVTISIEYDPDEIHSGKYVNVELKGALPFRNRFCAVGSTGGGGINNIGTGNKGSLYVSSFHPKNEKRLLLHGDLPHFVHLAEEEDDDDDTNNVDWEIIDRVQSNNTQNEKKKKLIRITLHKASPMEGVTLWWSKPLVHCPEVDVTSMQDRHQQRSSNSSKSDDGGIDNKKNKGEEFKKAWDEAHMLFRERMKEKKERMLHDGL